MKDRYQVVVIGGGIVGCSVLYHLTLRGLTDVALIEREDLAAGSSWHAAGGFHAINADTRIAALQKYTIGLYPQIEEESGQGIGLHMSGGLELAGTPERWQWLKWELAWHRTQGTEGARLVSPEEAAEMVPIIDPKGLHGALFDPHEGVLDPTGATTAYALAAKKRGAEVIQHNRVLSLQPRSSGWLLETEKGPVEAEHVINAAGLWARRVGRMVGVDHPLVPLVHHYLVTDQIPQIAAIEGEMPAVTDMEGFTYLQREGNGLLLGIYEQNPRHWAVEGAPWDFGRELFPEEIDRILPELQVGFERFPILQNVGIKKWVNGAFTFTPDGNPLVGPVAGLPGYWAACGVMAGYSQGAGIGLALANWMADGDPGYDVFGMDVARFGPFASEDKYLRDTTAQFYARRFVMAYPNEELPAGRPLKTTPCYDLFEAAGARFTVNWGLEVPLYFAPSKDFVENDTLGRSNAEPIVGEETRAVREEAGAYEIAQYARYEVTGPGAAQWLDHMVASRLPEVGRIRLAPMLNEKGHLMGDLSLTRLTEARFWITGSYYLQEWHARWFLQHMPEGVEFRNITEGHMGFSVSGPRSREILERLTHDDISNEEFPFLSVREMDVGTSPAIVGRISLTGELGYEIVVPTDRHRTLWLELQEAGADLGLRPIGDRAVDSLRLEKGYGIWSAEFRQDMTPAMTGLDRFVAFDKEDFVGREAALAERDSGGPARHLVLLQIDSDDADPSQDDGVWLDGKLVGLVTSAAYGHHVDKSLALAHVDTPVVAAGPELTVYVIGEPRSARILPEIPYDPEGLELRA